MSSARVESTVGLPPHPSRPHGDQEQPRSPLCPPGAGSHAPSPAPQALPAAAPRHASTVRCPAGCLTSPPPPSRPWLVPPCSSPPSCLPRDNPELSMLTASSLPRSPGAQGRGEAGKARPRAREPPVPQGSPWPQPGAWDHPLPSPTGGQPLAHRLSSPPPAPGRRRGPRAPGAGSGAARRNQRRHRGSWRSRTAPRSPGTHSAARPGG